MSDYNLSNYGYIETHSNTAIIAATKHWAVPLNEAALTKQKYYNLFMVDSSSPFCTMKCNIEGSRKERFVKIKPGITFILGGHNFRSLDIENLDTVTQIQVGEVTVTVMKELDRLSYLLIMKKMIENGGVIYG